MCRLEGRPGGCRGGARDPTPAQDDVPAQVSAAGEERDADQAVEVVSLGQQPAVVGHDAVVGERCGDLTAHLRGAAEETRARAPPAAQRLCHEINK